MDTYFPCKIYNTGDRRKTKPAYAILSMRDGFGVSEAQDFYSKNPPENIFIFINGQQAMNWGSRQQRDEQYCIDLSGSDKIGRLGDDSGVWQGDFKIHTYDSHPSVAGYVYKNYGSRDMIIDVVNAKYEWGETAKINDKSFDTFSQDLLDLITYIPNYTNKRYFISGFSRGGMFTLRLIDWLKNKSIGSDIIAVTLDPVQKYLKEGKDWTKSWCDWDIFDKKWVNKSGHKRINALGGNKYKFPVLRSKADLHYNVFERDVVVGTIESPIGGAVHNAIAPGYNLTGVRSEQKNKKIKKLPAGHPYDQLDVEERDHTIIPNKYRDWVIGIILRHYPLPSNEQPLLSDNQHDLEYDKIKKLMQTIIGNKRTKELHHFNCVWVNKMKQDNKIIFDHDTIDDLKRYDNCHWCLGGSKR